MIIQTSIFALPLAILLSAVDAYLFILGVRLIAGRIDATGRFTQCLRQLTDGIPQHIDRSIASRRNKPNPRWLSWVVVIVAGMVVRHTLISMLLTL